ncbi:MAG: hypothetical protein GY750_05870 [Lentisphaerae bacterium]|nr:hypothetical protein [Lentisphaerota bacterium]MCP4100937.1 hypothetical protein [Lentisphaerota bacterium]
MYRTMLLLFMFSVTAMATPFSSLWNISNARILGSPKSITEETEYSQNSKKVIVYNFSREGDVISQITLNGKSSPLYVTELEYDIVGNLKAMHVKRVSNNASLLSEEAEYDRGKLTSITRVNADGKIEATSDIACYPNRLVRSINMSSKLQSANWEFKFNDKQQLISSVFRENGQVIMKKNFSNDEHGNPVKIITFNMQTGSKVTTFLNYIYDEKGNWTSCSQEINSSWGGDTFKRQIIIKRKIVYYT